MTISILETAFKGKGYEVKTFAKGQEAKEFLLNETNIQSACLLVLDRLLPDTEGLETLKPFIEKYQHKIPVLILSSLSGEKDVMERLQKGAVDCITKPFSANVLLQKAISR